MNDLKNIRPVLSFKDVKKRVKPEFADECDINKIVDRCVRAQGGLPPQVGLQYGDVSQVPDFREIQHTMITAQNAFNSLDQKIRRRFGNDPREFYDFVMNEENRDECISLGFIAPLKTEVKTDASESPASSSTETT